MVAGLLIKILAHNNFGTLVLGVGLVCNTVYVFLRAGREQRLKDPPDVTATALSCRVERL